MKTKKDFQDAIASQISNYPTAAAFYRTQDPRLLAMLDSMATMLAMFSAEQEVAAAEPWTKARDVTVLADAAVKGVLPFGTPMRVRVLAANSSTQALAITTGRRILDSRGRLYIVQVGATVPAGGTASIEVLQQSEASFEHTVTLGQPFYTIQVPEREPGRHVVSVRLHDAQSVEFRYTPEFANVELEDKVFHLFSDENRRIYIELGANNLAGYQPETGEVLTITVVETEGGVELSSGSKFAFEYSGSIYESGVTLTLDEVLAPGATPMGVPALRELVNYPSIYDGSAVYLGNFDFLVRRTLSPFRFLSVWNEQIEEAVRGASLDNINRLFIAAKKDGVADATLRADIERVVLAADNSYGISWVTVQESDIPVTITLRVPDVYDKVAVAQQAREIILAQYGRDSAWARRGSGRVLYRRITSLLQSGISACQAETADIEVTVNDTATILPETYRYVSATSLTITVENSQ